MNSPTMTRLQFITRTMTLSVVACLLAQLFIGPGYDNLIACVLAASALLMLAAYLRLSRPFDDAPVSSLALLGFGTTALWASLVAQTLDLKPFVHQLRAPQYTFFILWVVMASALLGHWLYRRFAPAVALRDTLARQLLSPIGIHDVPRPVILWAFGSIGLVSMALGSAAQGDAAGKTVQAMQYFAWLPFLILMYRRQFGDAYCRLSVHLPFLALFALVIVGIAVGRNARQLMFIGPVTAMLIYLVSAIRESGPMPARSVVRVSVLLVVCALGVAMVSDLATAMAVAREKREGASAREMIEETYHTAFDRQKLDAYRQRTSLASVLENYDEAYLGNPVMARLSETKFHDNMLFFGQRMDGRDKAAILEELGFKIITIAPQPVLDFFDLDIQKYKYFYSMGDVYAETSIGHNVGGFITGSIWADLTVLTGPFLPFVVVALVIIVSIALDSLSRFDGGHFISPVALATAWTIFIYGLGGESIAMKVSFLMRDLPQKVVLYAIVFMTLRFLLRHGVHRPSTKLSPEVVS